MKEHFTLRYTSSEDNDTVMDLDMNFDNPTDEILVQRLTDWLKVIGKTNIRVGSSTSSDMSTSSSDMSTSLRRTSLRRTNCSYGNIVVN